MKAVQIENYGDNSKLKHVEISLPRPKANQVLVELKASAVNPVDFKIRSGGMAAQLPKQFPFTLGWEGAGIVTEKGDQVTAFEIGDEVMVMANFMEGGTYAEQIVVQEKEVFLKPKSLSFLQAATLPFSLGTAYTSLLRDANVEKGAGGAVGRMAVQIGKIKGLYVIGTAKGKNIQDLYDLGIDEVIDYTHTDFAQVLKELDVVLDLVGGANLSKSYEVIKKGGTLITTTQPPSPAALSKYEIAGKMTFTRPDPTIFEEIATWIDNGAIQFQAPEVFDLSEAQKALEWVENRTARSKVVFKF